MEVDLQIKQERDSSPESVSRKRERQSAGHEQPRSYVSIFGYDQTEHSQVFRLYA